jgi:hypothetical protein
LRLDDFLEVDLRVVPDFAEPDVLLEVDFRAEDVVPRELELFRPLVFPEVLPPDRRLLEADFADDFLRRAIAPAPAAPAAAPAATSAAGAAARLAT